MACDVLPVAMFFWLCTFSSMRCCIASTMNNGSLKVECLNIESLVARQMVRMTRMLGVASIRDNGRYLCLACQPSTNPFSDVPDKTEFPNVLFFHRTPSLNKKKWKKLRSDRSAGIFVKCRRCSRSVGDKLSKISLLLFALSGRRSFSHFNTFPFNPRNL